MCFGLDYYLGVLVFRQIQNLILFKSPISLNVKKVNKLTIKQQTTQHHDNQGSANRRRRMD